jgi:hypothetical protein
LRQLAVAGVGEATTTTAGPLGPLLARAVGLRPGTEPAELQIETGPTERWTRRFGPRRRSSRVHLDSAERLMERIGPLSLLFELRPSSAGTFAELQRIGVGCLRAPASWLLVEAAVRANSSHRRHRTTVTVVVGPRGRSMGPVAALTYTARLEKRS